METITYRIDYRWPDGDWTLLVPIQSNSSAINILTDCRNESAKINEKVEYRLVKITTTITETVVDI